MAGTFLVFHLTSLAQTVSQFDFNSTATLMTATVGPNGTSINPNTVAKAYGELSSQGFLESRKGLGIFVKERRQILTRAERNKRLNKAIDGFINEVVHLDIPPDDILKKLGDKLTTIVNTQNEKG